MRVELSDEQEFLRDAVAGALDRESPAARVREWAQERDTWPAERLAVAQGWTGIGLAEELGGQGGGVIELAVMAEQLGRTSTPWDRLLGSALALALLGACDSPEAHELAAAVADGDRSAVLCADGRRIPAPWPGTALGDGALTLRADDVPGAAGAELLVAVAGGGDEIELVSVAAADARVTPRPLVDHTRSLALVKCDGAPVVSIGSIAPAAFARAAGAAAVLVAADALGAAARLLEMTVAYVAQRRQFGVAVGSFQAVKHAAATMLVDVEGARSAVRYASWAVQVGAPDALSWASIAKLDACEAASRVADQALFLHGAIGYTWEHDLQFPFKRCKSDEPLFGGPDAHRDRIADGLALVSAPVPAG